MVGRMFLDVHRATDPFVFWLWFFVEMCVDLFVFSLLRGLRRRDTGETTMRSFNCPKGVKKRVKKYTLLVYPRAYMIFTELQSFS